MYIDENKKEIIGGVNCSVMECAYHNGVANCTAPFVNIKNSNFLLGAGTKCDSFKSRG